MESSISGMADVPRFTLKTGFHDHPDRVYLTFPKTRYWIIHPELFTACGLAWEDITAVSPGDGVPTEGRALATARDLLALLCLTGSGIEIGALHNPSLIAEDAQVRYVDYVAPEVSLERYKGIEPVVSAGVILDDGESLASFSSGSLDFIVANHFLEHTRNPLGVIRNHLDRLRPDGLLFYALPDKRHTFDAPRPLTPFAHLVMDDQHGPTLSDWSHYLEFVRYVDKVSEPKAIEAHARHLQESDNRIHYHVWDADGAQEMFSNAKAYLDDGFELIRFIADEPEVVAVLRKRAPHPAAHREG